MLKAAPVLGTHEQREIIEPDEIAERALQKRATIWTHDPTWRPPTREEMTCDGVASIRYAQYHEEIREQVAAVHSSILTFVGEEGDDKDVFAVQMFMGEATPNALKHGHRTDPNQPLYIAWDIRSGVFSIHYEQQTPFSVDQELRYDCTESDVLEVRHRRGIRLMRTYMDDVLWNRDGRHMYAERTLQQEP